MGREAFGEALRRLRGDLSVRELARLANCGKSYVSDLESGRRRPSSAVAAALDAALGASGELVMLAETTATQSALGRLEVLRQGMNNVVAVGPMTDAGIQDWEYIVEDHGRATRYRPEGEHLDDLTADFADLQRLLSHRHSQITRLQLMRIAAQLAGLISLTVLKLGEQHAAQRWFRTARSTAAAVDDPTVRSWVQAQEAYALYYRGNVRGAVDSARLAQKLAEGAACVGAALAAPLEARALAMLRLEEEATRAIDQAELALNRLGEDAVDQSAFGYSEAQLRFHQGNALTHLRLTTRAHEMQQPALQLYPTSDYTDRTLIQLDRAMCLAHEGDAATAMAQAAETIAALPIEYRSGLIVRVGEWFPTSAALAAGDAGILRGARATRRLFQHLQRRVYLMTLTVDHAHADDIDTIADLIGEIETYYGATDIAPVDQRMKQIKSLIFGERPVAQILLARDGERVLGIASYSFHWPAVGASHSLFLKEIYVRQGDRRKGVGRLLMCQLEKIAAESGCIRVEWQTEQDNIDAQRFYDSIGARIHEGKIFYRVET